MEKTKQREQECVREHMNEQCFFGTKYLSIINRRKIVCNKLLGSTSLGLGVVNANSGGKTL